MINRRSLGAALFVVLTLSVCSEAQVSEPPGLIGLWAAEGNTADSASTNNGTRRPRSAFDRPWAHASTLRPR